LLLMRASGNAFIPDSLLESETPSSEPSGRLISGCGTISVEPSSAKVFRRSVKKVVAYASEFGKTPRPW
jgi:hypothetical protein